MDPSGIVNAENRTVERSMSPDLVSLSSTSGDESAELEDLGVSRRLSLSQEDSDITEGPSAPLSLAGHDRGRLPLAQSVGADTEISDREDPESHHSLVQSSQSSQLQSSQLSDQDLHASVPAGLTSSVLLVDKEKLAISDYESKGMLYARSSKARHNM